MTVERLVVINASDAFTELWPQIGRVAGVAVESASRPNEARLLQSACAVILNVAGVENTTASMLSTLTALGAPQTAVVGCEPDHRLASQILKGGASEYFAFPDDVGLCQSWVSERAQAARNRTNGLAFAADERERFDFSNIIGESPVLRSTLRQASKVIPKGSATVLITGETGTGKDLLARAIHFNGPRRAGPLVEVNCTTLPDNLLEAELFGYEPGAFTDARTAKPGLFEVANGGSLFLDEIGDITHATQAKLLRVLESKTVRRLGSVRDVEVNVRIIAATNVDLEESVANGKFRADLYYRLNIVPLRLPPLRQRGEDVLLLAEYFLQKISQDYEVRPPLITIDIRRVLMSHSWPGNIRELRNSIERGILLGGGYLFAHDLVRESSGAKTTSELPFPAALKTIEEFVAKAMVSRCNGNKSEAAKLLGISRKHLYSLLARN